MLHHDTNLTVIEERLFKKLEAVCNVLWIDRPVEVLLDSISITQPPIKSSYYIGDTLDLTGLEITAYYTDNSSRVLSDTEYNLTIPPDVTVTVGIKEITASFTDGTITKTAAFNIAVEVVPLVLVNIAIEHLPNKIQYNHNENFDTEGLIVKAFYDDSTEKILTDTDYTLTPYANGDELSSTGTIMETISFTDNGVTMTATFDIEIAAVLIAITITSLPKTNYYEGDTFTTSGMVVEGTWSDGTQTPFIDGWTTSPYTDGDVLSTLSDDIEITVTYQTFTDNYAIKVELKPNTVIELTFNTSSVNIFTIGNNTNSYRKYNWDISVDDGVTWTNYNGTGGISGISLIAPNNKVLIKAAGEEIDGWLVPFALNNIFYGAYATGKEKLVKFEIKSLNPNVNPWYLGINNKYYLLLMFNSCSNLEEVIGEFKPMPEGSTNCEGYLAYMYQKCSKLVSIPNCPAFPKTGTIFTYLFQQFLDECSLLETMPDIPGLPLNTTSVNYAYLFLFNKCSKLGGTGNFEIGNESPLVRTYINTFINRTNAPQLTVNVYQKGGYPIVDVLASNNVVINYINVDLQNEEEAA